MNNKLVIVETSEQKQKNFMKKIVSKRGDKAKKILLQQLNRATIAVIDLKIDILANGVNVGIYDIDYQDTDGYFQKLKKIVSYIDFILEKEINSIIDIAQLPTEEDITEMEIEQKRFEEAKAKAEKTRKLRDKADKVFNDEIKTIRTKEGDITFDY